VLGQGSIFLPPSSLSFKLGKMFSLRESNLALDRDFSNEIKHITVLKKTSVCSSYLRI
jgi:hypothetical protein